MVYRNFNLNHPVSNLNTMLTKSHKRSQKPAQNKQLQITNLKKNFETKHNFTGKNLLLYTKQNFTTCKTFFFPRGSSNQPFQFRYLNKRQSQSYLKFPLKIAFPCFLLNDKCQNCSDAITIYFTCPVRNLNTMFTKRKDKNRTKTIFLPRKTFYILHGSSYLPFSSNVCINVSQTHILFFLNRCFILS